MDFTIKGIDGYRFEVIMHTEKAKNLCNDLFCIRPEAVSWVGFGDSMIRSLVTEALDRKMIYRLG